MNGCSGKRSNYIFKVDKSNNKVLPKIQFTNRKKILDVNYMKCQHCDYEFFCNYGGPFSNHQMYSLNWYNSVWNWNLQILKDASKLAGDIIGKWVGSFQWI